MTRCEMLSEKITQFCDLALITSDVNRRYFSGMKSSAGYIAVLKDKAYLLIDFRYYEKACSMVHDCEVVRFISLKETLGEICDKHNVKTIAIESKVVTVDDLSFLKKIFPNMSFESSSQLSNTIEQMRIIKDSEEFNKITKAQRIAEAAFDELLSKVHVGMTEREIALLLDFEMQKRGSEGVSFDTIALSGQNTSLPHGVPSDKEICNGEFVLCDFGAVYEGYHSDMTRTFCMGEPSDEMKRVYSIVLEAQGEALSFVKSGISGKELDEKARSVIESYGFGENFGHSLGHGVGLEIHEMPNAAPSSSIILSENMIITVEPGIYLTGKFGVRIEDFVYITSNGCVNITKTEKTLKCL